MSFKKGQIAWNKGKKGGSLSEEHKKKIGLNGFHYGMLGRKHKLETILKMKKYIGEQRYNYKKDRNLLPRYNLQGDPAYKQWRSEVYKRDSWKCKISNLNCFGKIEAHHILPWRDYPELRYNINNGITLCHAHHPRKRAEEKRLSPYFMELVSVSKDPLC